jgi:hypothetical protein
MGFRNCTQVLLSGDGESRRRGALSAVGFIGGRDPKNPFLRCGLNLIGMPPAADLKGWIAPENGNGEE